MKRVRDAWDSLLAVPARLRRVAAWLPVIWRDNDYAFSASATILSFKMRRLADHMKTCAYHDHARDIRELRRAAAHFDRYRDSWPYTPCWYREYWENDQRSFSERMAEARSQRMVNAQRNTLAFEERNWTAAWKLMEEKGQHWSC